MSLLIIFSIILIHFFADFVLQTEWQATNKSKDNKALTMHVLSYSTVWFLIANVYSIITGNYLVLALFAPITFVSHWITDYFTSRLNSKLWKEQKVHYFFCECRV
jgi:heme/copper-type cytochrome/quinol oxidase subunit 2